MRSLALLLLSSVLVSCGSSPEPDPQPKAPQPIVDLRADVNRNGTVDLDDPTEDQGEESWDDKHGAIFLANVDDDLRACPTKDASGRNLSDDELAKCNDAANEVVDGDDDLLDLARLKTVPWQQVPKDAVGTLALSKPAHVRLFKRTGEGFVLFDPESARLDADEIANGVELAIEGKDVLRDASSWDGVVDVTFRVKWASGEASDVVRMRQAPIVLSHHGSPAERILATRVAHPDWAVFRSDLRKAVGEAKLPPLEELDVPDEDPWTQDFFETGYMSMPAPNGAQHVMRVVLRSANVYNPGSARYPLRPAGRLVFTKFRGKDVAGVLAHSPKSDPDMDSLNSLGNTETIPPFEGRPLGRILLGSTPSFHPDPLYQKLLEAQRVQEPVLVDTSWLFIGHVDETVSFVPMPAKTPRPWLLLANDARLAKTMLEEQVAKGNGAIKMFAAMSWLNEDDEEVPAETSISEVLADADVMAESQRSAAEVDAQIAILAKATGVTPAEIVPVPFLHMKVLGKSIAYQPATVNGTLVGPALYAAPNPHGPVVDGKDIMKTQLEAALGSRGVKVAWVEDWNGYHRNFGEVHCGSNAFRAVPAHKWWEAPR